MSSEGTKNSILHIELIELNPLAGFPLYLSPLPSLKPRVESQVATEQEEGGSKGRRIRANQSLL